MYMDLYVLILEQEDYRRIYGIFDNYITAQDNKNKLKKYNEMCLYGVLKIYEYKANELYMKEQLKFIN